MANAYERERARQALERLVAPHGATSFGVVFEGDSPWGPSTCRTIYLTDTDVAMLDHDEREAPRVMEPNGAEDDSLLVSLTDEGLERLCAWVRVEEGSRVRGLGVDLASTDDFAGERGARFNRLLFTAEELAWAEARVTSDALELSLAYAFSAKEAAFKCLAAPLRSWYSTHTEELVFDLRDFELADDQHEVGSARRGAASSAMDAMGISCIELSRTSLGPFALTFAIAVADREASPNA